MTDQRPITTLPQSSYTIKEAAELIGKSDITVVRWCRDEVFPNAGKVPGPKGDEWSIPADDLAQVIADKKITIDLRDQSQSGTDRSNDQASEEMIGLLQQNAELREKTGHLTGQAEQQTRQLERLSSDIDHLRAEHERTLSDLTESERARGVLEGKLENGEQLRSQIAQERDSLDQKYLELQKTSAETLSAISADLETARTERQETVGERDDLATKAQKLEDAMGWWSRRKYERNHQR